MEQPTIDILKKEFSKKNIKTRRGAHGKALSYVEGANVIRRLNTAFKHDWSFEIIDHQILETDVVVIGKLTAMGFIKSHFGTAKIKRGQNKAPAQIGDDLKAAGTDALKKCASLFGIGLHLWTEDGEENFDEDEEKGEYGKAPLKDKTSKGKPVKKTHTISDTYKPDPATDQQKKSIRDMAKNLGIDISDLLKEQNAAMGSLTACQADDLIKGLTDEVERRKEPKPAAEYQFDTIRSLAKARGITLAMLVERVGHKLKLMTFEQANELAGWLTTIPEISDESTNDEIRSEAQMGKIHVLRRELKLELDDIRPMFGGKSSKDLTVSEASHVIEELIGMTKSRQQEKK